MIFDSTLTFDKQINAAVKTSFFQCQGLARVKQFLCFRHREGYPFLSFMSSGLDYCNTLYSGVGLSLLV